MPREDEIDAQLRRILESPVFAASARSKQFLEYCVNRSRIGGGSQLKETTIALEVFLRPVDYDPKSDPIVRVHARRVREKLHLYYRTIGADDPIKIALPKGSYIPVIEAAEESLLTPGSFPSVLSPPPALETQAAGVSLPGVSGEETAKSSISRDRRFSPWGMRMAGALVLAALIALWYRTERLSTAKAAYLHALHPLSNLPDGACDASWAPSGNRLAFAAPGSGSNVLHIFVADLHSDDKPLQLTNEDLPDSRPVWSPNGNEIAFVRVEDFAHFRIVRLNLATHQQTLVGRFVSYWPTAMDHPALDWSSDGRFFLTSEQSAPETPMRLVVVSAVNGSRRILTSPPSISSGDVEAKFSPDGQTVAFRRGGQGDLFTVSIRGEAVEPAHRLTNDTKGVRGIAWEGDGQSILFGSQRTNTAAFAIWRISIHGGDPVEVTEPGFSAENPSLSPAGLLVEHEEVISEIAEQKLALDASPVPVISSHALDSGPAYSPDGSSLAFISTRSGWSNLWLRKENADPVQLTHQEGVGMIFTPSWAPDGHALAFSARNHGATNVYVYDLKTKSTRKLTSSLNRDINPVYSSDSRTIFYSSNDDGTSRIWKIREDGSELPEPLFVEGVMGFQASVDGKWLYYWQSDQTFTLARRNLIDGSTESLFTIPGRPSFLGGRYIAQDKVFVASSTADLSEADIFEVNAEKKQGRLVTRLHDIAPMANYVLAGMSVRPDGEALIYSHLKSKRSTILWAKR